jgi:hypothetical protein
MSIFLAMLLSGLPAWRLSIGGIGGLSFEITVTFSVGQEVAYASPDWWDTDWQYRIKFTIDVVKMTMIYPGYLMIRPRIMVRTYDLLMPVMCFLTTRLSSGITRGRLGSG